MARQDENQAIGFTPDQFAQILATIKDSGATGHTAELRDILLETAKVSAQTMKKALKPENDSHPGISGSSYPEGDAAKPRPVLPFELFVNGYPAHMFPESLHWYELELLVKLAPGEYHISRSDMTTQKVSLTGHRDADGKVMKIEWTSPMSREESRLAAPLAVQAYQILHADRPLNETYLEGTTKFLQHVVMRQAPVAEAVGA